MKSSTPGSSSGKLGGNRAFKFFRYPDDFPFRSSQRDRASFSSALPGSSPASTSTSPSKIRSNTLACSPGLSPSFASKALITPACDSLNSMSPIFNLFRTVSASIINSTSARGDPTPISSAPHCHPSLVFFPVCSKIKTLAT
ncbi:hypothetical protein ES703_10356 [subsurface metagenome]